MKQLFKLTSQQLSIQVEAEIIGMDLLLVVTGGSHPHIGTVTTYCKEIGKKETIRFPSQAGHFHKDDLLADILLEAISEDVWHNVTIISGVHVDGITKIQIETSLRMAKKLGEELAAWIRSLSLDFSHPTYYYSE